MDAQQRWPNGTVVRFNIAQAMDIGEGVIVDAAYDDGWVYRIDVTEGSQAELHWEADGSLWVCEFEVQPL